MTPARDWKRRRVLPEVWLLCEREAGDPSRRKFYFVHLPATHTKRGVPGNAVTSEEIPTA